MCTTVLGAGAGVCSVCHGPASIGWARCFCCVRVAARLPAPPAPVVPISSVIVPSPLYAALHGCKDASVRESRHHFAGLLSSLLDSFLSIHRPCLETLVGGILGPLVAVPSTTRRGPAPFGALLRSRQTEVLVRGPDTLGHGRPSNRGFAVADRARSVVEGRRVLLLDDTLTTGARAQSAASALVAAGSAGVVIVVLGRVLRPDRNACHARYWRRAVAQEYRLDRCCLPRCSG